MQVRETVLGSVPGGGGAPAPLAPGGSRASLPEGGRASLERIAVAIAAQVQPARREGPFQGLLRLSNREVVFTILFIMFSSLIIIFWLCLVHIY